MVARLAAATLVLAGCVDALPSQMCFGDVDCPNGAACQAGVCVGPDAATRADVGGDPDGPRSDDANRDGPPTDGAAPDGLPTDGPARDAREADAPVADMSPAEDGGAADVDVAPPDMRDPDAADGDAAPPDAAPRAWIAERRRGHVAGDAFPISGGDVVVHDGWAFVAEDSNRQVVAFHIETGQRIHVAGSGRKWSDPRRDGSHATTRGMYQAQAMTVNDDGDLFVGTVQRSRVLRVGRDTGNGIVIAHEAADAYAGQGALAVRPADLPLAPELLLWLPPRELGPPSLLVGSPDRLERYRCSDERCHALEPSEPLAVDVGREASGSPRIARAGVRLVVNGWDPPGVWVTDLDGHVLQGPFDRLDAGQPEPLPVQRFAAMVVESHDAERVALLAILGARVLRVVIPADAEPNAILEAQTVANSTGCAAPGPGCGCVLERPDTPAGVCLVTPRGVAVDADGRILISDAGRLWLVEGERIRALGGDGEVLDIGDGGPATSARLFEPAGLAAGDRGIYIADRFHGRVRLASRDGRQITSGALGRNPWAVTLVGETAYASACACERNDCGALERGVEPGVFALGDEGWASVADRTCAAPPRPLRPGGLGALGDSLLVADGPRLLERAVGGAWSVWNDEEAGWPGCMTPFPDGTRTRVATGMAVDDAVYVAYRAQRTQGAQCVDGPAGVARYSLPGGDRLADDWGTGAGALDPLGDGIAVEDLQAERVLGLAAAGGAVYVSGDFVTSRLGPRGIVEIRGGVARAFAGFAEIAEREAVPEGVGGGRPPVPFPIVAAGALTVDDGYLYWAERDHVRRALLAGGPVEYFAGRRDPVGVRAWADGAWLPTPSGLTPVPGGGFFVAGGHSGRVYRIDDEGVSLAAFAPDGVAVGRAPAPAHEVDLMTDVSGVVRVGEVTYVADRVRGHVVALRPGGGGEPAQATLVATLEGRAWALEDPGDCGGEVLVAADDRIHAISADGAPALLRVEGRIITSIATQGSQLALVTLSGVLRVHECLGVEVPERHVVDVADGLQYVRQTGRRILIAALGGDAYALASGPLVVRWHPDEGVTPLFDARSVGTDQSYVSGLTRTEDGLAYTDGWAGVLVELRPPR